MTWRRVTAVGLLGAAIVTATPAIMLHAKACVAQVLLHRAWGQALEGASQPRPWPWADTWAVARLELPSLGWHTIVLDGASGRELAFAPGRLHGSARPGQPGPCVIAGHRDTQFSVLRRLRPGDPIRLQDRSGTWTRFRVRETAVVDHLRHGLSIEPGHPTELVLVTCWPFDAITPGGPWRYVVLAGPDTERSTRDTPRAEVTVAEGCSRSRCRSPGHRHARRTPPARYGGPSPAR